jgi:hypothetical protein
MEGLFEDCVLRKGYFGHKKNPLRNGRGFCVGLPSYYAWIPYAWVVE